MARDINILLVDDNPDDIELTREALASSKIHINSLNVLYDGIEALAYLRKEGEYEVSIRPGQVECNPAKSGSLCRFSSFSALFDR